MAMTVPGDLSAAVKLTSSRRRSSTVWRRRAPMFSTAVLISSARPAISSMASSLKSSVALGGEQRLVLLDEARLGLDQDAAEILAVERLQFDADRQSPLQLRQQVGGLCQMERTRRDEKHVVGFDRAVF